MDLLNVWSLDLYFKLHPHRKLNIDQENMAELLRPLSLEQIGNWNVTMTILKDEFYKKYF